MKKKLSPLPTVMPTALWMLLFVIIPLLFVVLISFTEKSTYGGIRFVWSTNGYKDALTPENLNIFLSSLRLSVETTVICLAVGYPFAWILAHADAKYKTLLLMLLILPFWVNSIIRLYGWQILLRNEGVLNTLLIGAHIIQKPIGLLYTDGAVLLGMVYDLLPFTVLPLYSSIEKLDGSLIEAATDLGAGSLHTFSRVIVPETMPGIFAGTVQTFIPSLGLFYISELMGGGTANTIGNIIKNQFQSGRNWPCGAALALLLIGITLILTRLYIRAGGNLDDMA